ncbi:DUF6118 family protein [Pseudochelatococcus contaminans]|jgi:hypothetical protein|uniref:Uncharacterized protein n=1 Tax=Pseudochelatococcus contaminans TaxID=1538103 RepID=A0A7W5Z8F2_9HYPH|nr:DUF6118 family protein [Pseudochelatococcus contaminans]MBB3811524.1 hypothetical protein [Pseudochelatococcus contaminans]
MTELDDDREGFEPEALDEDEAGDPAAAFDALRRSVEGMAADLTREMTTIRKGVETAFEEFDRQGPPQDYKPELAQLVQQLGVVAERLHGVEQSPILRQGAQHYAAALERAGEGLVKAAVQKLERQASDLERISGVLASHNKSAFHRKDQDFRMWMVGLVGLFVGIFLTLLLPRFLPFSADSRVAGLVMGQDRVSAGRTMIEAADPKRSQDIVTAGWVYETNRTALDKCIADMFQSKKEQRCPVVLPVVESNARR